MNMQSTLAKLSAFALFLVCQVAKGEVVYQQTYAYNASQSGAISSTVGYNQEIADNFQLSNTATIKNVSWWGGWSGQSTTDTTATFQLQFYNTSASPTKPTGTALLSESVTATITADGAFNSSGGTMYRFDATLSGSFTATGGTEYWLAIWNTAAATGTSQKFIWATATNGLDRYGYSSNTGSTWTGASDGAGAGTNGRNYEAFTLSTAAVPEPGTMALAGIASAMGGLGVWRKKRRKMTKANAN